jgi:hypothetical protein
MTIKDVPDAAPDGAAEGDAGAVAAQGDAAAVAVPGDAAGVAVQGDAAAAAAAAANVAGAVASAAALPAAGDAPPGAARAAPVDSAYLPDVSPERRLTMETEAGMREFHIRGRVESRGGAFVALVLAIPLLEDEPELEMQDTCRSRALAVERLHSLAIAMGKKLRADGASVIDVKLED